MGIELPDVEILYEEGPCLVINKPGGLLTQGPPGIDSLERRVKQFLIIRENKPGKAYLGVPHRLDRPVSGAIVFAKHVRAARRISEQFEQRTVSKKYWTVVQGQLPDDEGTWQDHMRKMTDRAQSEVVPEDHPDAQLARLQYRVLGRSPRGTWIEIELETGRTHQIRVQTSSRGFPIIGDELYGATTPFGPETIDLRQRWIALHARQLVLQHPMTQDPIDVTCPLPDAWSDLGTI